MNNALISLESNFHLADTLKESGGPPGWPVRTPRRSECGASEVEAAVLGMTRWGFCDHLA